MRALREVERNARKQAKDIDKFAVCCSDGGFEYARTEDVAMDILDEIRAIRRVRRPDLDFEFDVISLDSDGGELSGDT